MLLCSHFDYKCCTCDFYFYQTCREFDYFIGLFRESALSLNSFYSYFTKFCRLSCLPLYQSCFFLFWFHKLKISLLIFVLFSNTFTSWLFLYTPFSPHSRYCNKSLYNYRYKIIYNFYFDLSKSRVTEDNNFYFTGR